MFDPIAVVGRGCVLPGALSPSALWDNIIARRVSLSPVPAEHWRLEPRLMEQSLLRLLGRPAGRSAAATNGYASAGPAGVGGYVRGFSEVFDPAGFHIDRDDLISLDPLFHWAMHCGREALREAGLTGPLPRAGLVLGNLGYPGPGMAQFAEHVWARSLPEKLRRAVPQGPDPDPRNRFSCGLSAHLTARALGLGGGSLALDAACASSLYAIKIAIDRLHDGSADVMLAAAVNRCDGLFLHAGFGALQAISPTGQSRPFHRAADGLVPAEGAACVALMRLTDAVRADVPVLAVIRGIGLSNGGRGQGLLAPCQESQERAMLAAYRAAQVPPDSVSLLECHATGTRLGDAVEVRGVAKVFSEVRDLPVGSVKSNLGHPVTVAGLAGLLKLIGALRAGIRPATLSAGDPTQALAGSSLRPLQENEPWEGLRRAALNTFGFGGNNAHLVLDGWPCPYEPVSSPPPAARSGRPARTDQVRSRHDAVAIVAIGARVGDGCDAGDFAGALLAGRATDRRRKKIETPLLGLRFPPADLEQAHAQQLLILDAAREALAGRQLSREDTMVLIGMGCDAEVARYTARWRIRSLLADHSWDTAVVRAAEDAFSAPLTAAGVVGTMPNIVANRLNSQFDLAGTGFSIFAEQASGLAALELGCRALRAGEADAVLAGAVDLSCEPVHEASLQALGLTRPSGDAAVVLLLRRLADAERDGDEIIALIDDTDAHGTDPGLSIGPREAPNGIPAFDPVTRFGSAHAAEGLVAVAAAALAVRHRAVPRADGPADALLGEPIAEVTAEPLGAPAARVRIRGARPTSWSPDSYSVHVFCGRDREEVAAALRGERTTDTGPWRLALVERPYDDMAGRREAARRWLAGEGERPVAMAFRTEQLTGEVAFVYTNGSACYPKMGRSLMLAFPELMDEIKSRSGRLAAISEPVLAGAPTSPVRRNLAATLLADLHTRLTRDRLGIHPDAVLGYSSGEGSAMVALGVWRDVPELVTEMVRTDVFTRGLVGEQQIPRQAWRRMALPADRWVNFLVAAPAEQVHTAVRTEKTAYVLVANAPGVFVIGGAAAACERVVHRLGGTATVIPTGYDIAAHAPVLNEAREELWGLYHRRVHAEDGIRFYSGTSGTAYLPTSENVADALTTLTLDQVDFAGTVRNAWNDGVRIFIEHGPRGLCSGWISRILRGRDHLAVALDGPGESEDDRGRLAVAVAELAAAGVPMHRQAVLGSLSPYRTTIVRPAQALVTPAHPPLVAAGLAGLDLATPARNPSDSPVTPERLGDTGDSQHPDPRSDGHSQADQPRPSGSPAAAARLLAVAPTAPALRFDRAQLERLASGNISDILGSRFSALDGRARHTRMPEPPMLLTDRVVGLDAEPGSLGKGVIWTETDIGRDAWYLDSCGRIPPGLLVESGQADLLLLSWLGADLHIDKDRVYRLLGCDLTFFESPARIGETLRHEISIDGRGAHDGVHLFFFHSRCEVGGQPRLAVSNGQAGYFTDSELAASQGILWDPTQSEPPPGRTDPPAVATARRSFDYTQVRAFAEGRPDRCFGPGWETTRAHLRSPRIGHGRMQLLHQVREFDPRGGPWQRGYSRAEFSVSPEEWFFRGHFKNDPCMPGTLMFEGCLQAMAFHLTAMGYTIDRDGWRFEPVPDQTYQLRCRGQVTPASRCLTYEIFVSEVTGGPRPVLYADALCTVDGLKAFHARRLGLRLVPDWPLQSRGEVPIAGMQLIDGPVPAPHLAGAPPANGHPAEAADRAEYPDLLAAAWGPPSDSGDCAPIRLPGPPYLFMSRVRNVDAPSAGPGASVVAEYDVPRHAWYWKQNGFPTAPLAVLVELALQPCKWLVERSGLPPAGRPEVRLRNLGGSVTVLRELMPATGTVTTEARLTGVTEEQDLTVITFDVTCQVDGSPALNLSTEFGLLSKDRATWRSGNLPCAIDRGPSPGALSEGKRIDLRTRPPHLFGGRLRLADGPMLLMIDRLTELRPDGGAAGLGRIRTEKDVDPADWYFKAHSFQDPVLPTGLALEGICQTLQLYMIETGLHADVRDPRFQPSRLGHAMAWKHGDHVDPFCGQITIDMEVTAAGADTTGHYAVADARLWADDICICEARGVGMRIVPRERTGASGRSAVPRLVLSAASADEPAQERERGPR
ncbi:beta-ketoacyl synthase N-terminal-like domain-containing protein [Nocardia goodfellowii]